MSKFDIASFPIVLLGISSTLDPVELTELVEDQIRYRFARIPGVASIKSSFALKQVKYKTALPLPTDGRARRSGRAPAK